MSKARLSTHGLVWEELLRQAPEGHDFVREYQFDPIRLWRFDIASPRFRVALEVNGRGRHQRILGERQDYEKIRAAILDGWYVLPFQACDRGGVRNVVIDFITTIYNRVQREQS